MGEDVFSRATISGKDRQGICNNLVGEFSNCVAVAMDDFEVHVTMRIIKNIMREPFGKVISVPSGVGGKSGAGCFFEKSLA